jgi:hypothetical protein
MKLLGKLLCKFLTYWFTSKRERDAELSKCLRCLEPQKLPQNNKVYSRQKPKYRPKKRKNFGAKKD